MDKKAKISFIIIVIVIIVLIAIVALIGYFLFYRVTNQHSFSEIENPINQIILANTENGIVNQSAVISEGIKDFDENYINYLIGSIGVSSLRKSTLGYGNPKLEIVFDDKETWNSEIGSDFITQKGASDRPDIIIKMSKEEAVSALLASDIKQFMKDEVSNGKVQIEMVAGKVELFSKGYLDMYKSLTGKDASM
jgi:hypothetical protein